MSIEKTFERVEKAGESGPIIGPDNGDGLNPPELAAALATELVSASIAQGQMLTIEEAAEAALAEVAESTTNAPRFWQESEANPQHRLLKEEPQHRAILYLAAQGNTNTEISRITGFTTAMIAYVKKQPWAQERIAALMEKTGESAVKQMLEGCSIDAVKLLTTVIRDEEVAVALRVKEANNLLNRLYGQAPQTIVHKSDDLNEMDDQTLLAIANGRKVAAAN